MAKFKVGDRVRVGDNAGFSRGSVGKVTEVVFGGWDFGVLRDGARSTLGFSEGELNLIAPIHASPTRTVTRTEIVPGPYGHILVDRTANDGSLVLLGFKSTGGIFPEVRSNFTAAELTDAIATLTAIRDALVEVA